MTPSNNTTNIYGSTMKNSGGMKGMYSSKVHGGSSKQLFKPTNFQLKNFDTPNSQNRGYKKLSLIHI